MARPAKIVVECVIPQFVPNPAHGGAGCDWQTPRQAANWPWRLPRDGGRDLIGGIIL